MLHPDVYQKAYNEIIADINRNDSNGAPYTKSQLWDCARVASDIIRDCEPGSELRTTWSARHDAYWQTARQLNW